mgnify:CR=1
MADQQTAVRQCECLRCGHTWVPRVAGRPVSCPRCKSYKYDEPAGKDSEDSE